MIVRAYLGLGGNLGNRAHSIEKALILLADHPDIEIVRVAGNYETEPVHIAQQPDDPSPVPWFLNTALALDTTLSPQALLAACAQVEAMLGRIRPIVHQCLPDLSDSVRTQPDFISGVPAYASRTLDIDILFYGSMVLDEPDLKIPHPRMHQRAFVLAPLAEIAPEIQHPILKRSVHVLYQDLPHAEQISRIDDISAVRNKSEALLPGHL